MARNEGLMDQEFFRSRGDALFGRVTGLSKEMGSAPNLRSVAENLQLPGYRVADMFHGSGWLAIGRLHSGQECSFYSHWDIAFGPRAD